MKAGRGGGEGRRGAYITGEREKETESAEGGQQTLHSFWRDSSAAPRTPPAGPSLDPTLTRPASE